MTNDDTIPSTVDQVAAWNTYTAGPPPCDPHVGRQLKTYAASKPHGLFLELGTGNGISTAWLADGMQPGARLITVDRDPAAPSRARTVLGHQRIVFITSDAATFLTNYEGPQFDLIVTDLRPSGTDDHPLILLNLAQGGVLYSPYDTNPATPPPPPHHG